MGDNNNNPERKKIINVTKPQQPSMRGNIDTSRVSAYTAREQQSLEKLKKKVGTLNAHEKRSSNFKTIIAIVLVVILILLAVLFILFIGKTETTPEESYDMRLSMQIENKSTLSVITEAGEQLREINPGDKIPLRASVRNSQDIRGDVIDEGTSPPHIYVRFRLVLILDYEERYDIMIPTMPKNWYKFDRETEDKFVGGVKEDDHYYYYIGSLAFMEPQDLFTQIEFDGNAITCDDGGKYGQIQVHVESIEANISTIMSRSVWPTAPQGWVSEMIALWNNNLI